MTYTITNQYETSPGNTKGVRATVDITSLDSANYEPFDPATEFGLEGAGVSVVGVENADQYIVQYDHLTKRLYVEGYGGTDPTATTDVGEVLVDVRGDRGP